MTDTATTVQHSHGPHVILGCTELVIRDGHVVALVIEAAYAPRIAELLDRHGLVDVPDAINTWPPTDGRACEDTVTTRTTKRHDEATRRTLGQLQASRLKTEVNIYLAGKITKNGWRDKFVAGLRGAYSDADLMTDEGWPVLRDALGEGLHYVGPYFVSCDHGCAHGGQAHGTTGGCVVGAGSPSQQRSRAVRYCLKAIERADVVIALVEPDAHGTLVEIGYARALGKRIYAVNPASADWITDIVADEWFAYYASGLVTETVEEALTDVRERVLAPTENLEEKRCESPIEVQFLRAMRKHNSLDMFQVAVPVMGRKYRIDFADPARQIGVELDGYEHHIDREQFTRDRARQRDLELAGWRLVRFSGREVHQDVDRCVHQFIEWLGTVTTK